jgi:hypothetical protein
MAMVCCDQTELKHTSFLNGGWRSREGFSMLFTRPKSSNRCKKSSNLVRRAVQIWFTRCCRVGWPGRGNLSTPAVRFYSSKTPIILTTFVYHVNTDPLSNFTLLPRHPRPVQGKHPEGPSKDLAPYSRNVASGLFSHPNPLIRFTRPHALLSAFSHFPTLFFLQFRTLWLGTTSLFSPFAFV